MIPHFHRLLSNRYGATAIEYGLIGSIIALAIIAGFGFLSGQIESTFLALRDAMLPS
jgi:pilus assembly protein Flp/PilA